MIWAAGWAWDLAVDLGTCSGEAVRTASRLTPIGNDWRIGLWLGMVRLIFWNEILRNTPHDSCIYRSCVSLGTLDEARSVRHSHHACHSISLEVSVSIAQTLSPQTMSTASRLAFLPSQESRLFHHYCIMIRVTFPQHDRSPVEAFAHLLQIGYHVIHSPDFASRVMNVGLRLAIRRRLREALEQGQQSEAERIVSMYLSSHQ